MTFVRKHRKPVPLTPRQQRRKAQAVSVNQHRKAKITLPTPDWEKDNKNEGAK